MAQKRGTEMPETVDISALIHSRGLAKRSVTRIRKIIEEAQVQQSELTPAQVKVYQRSVETAYKEYINLHQNIVAQVPSAQREEQDNHYFQFVDQYETVSIFLENWMSKFNTPLVPPQQPVENRQQLIVQPSLPRAIPTFDGRYEQWEKFKVIFKDVVDKSNEPDRIKLYHLEKALIGDAIGLIDSKTIADGNYERAWQILDERFSDKRRMIDRHLASLLSVKKIQRESFSELRSLVENFENHVENLKFLGQEFTGVSDYFIVFVIARALDDDTKKLWETTVKKGMLPSYEQTIQFLKERVSVLERCQTSTDVNQLKMLSAPKSASFKHSSAKSSHATTSLVDHRCDVCTDSHLTFKCPTFNQLSVSQRIAKVKERNLCFNCLRRGHRVGECPSKKSCSRCQRRHHSLLHLEGNIPSSKQNEMKEVNHRLRQVSLDPASSSEVSVPAPACKPSTSGAIMNTAHSRVPVGQVFLLTAVVDVLDSNQQLHQCRALIDSGSQVSIITQSLANALNLSTSEVSVPIFGIGNAKSFMKQMGNVQVRSRCNNFGLSLTCLVSPKITGPLPSVSIDIASWEIPPGIQLADPSFYKSNSIDMLIGMDYYWDVMKPGFLKLSDELPSFHDSHFGWLVGGPHYVRATNSVALRSYTICADPIDQLLQKFWEVESVPSEITATTEQEECENHFLTTHRRDESGRYVVQLPLKAEALQLPDSRSLALRRFYALEAKLSRNPDLKVQYDAFIDEYESLNHCREIQESSDPPGLMKWYLPHHAVLRPSSTSTKCRTVFDASAKVQGRSLNDVMMIGPTIQPDLLSIILRFRKFQFVLSADIGKMYRQILVDPVHTPLQRIFWRKSPTERLRVLELNTVTYGTAAAPFLATRALLQLAKDERDRFPLAAHLVEEYFYVDNALYGSNNFQEAELMRDQLIALLQSGGMHLHKWASNTPKLLDPIPIVDRDTSVNIGDSGVNEIIKTLGLMWDPNTDELVFLTNYISDIEIPTKRQVLSIIARVFDPLGLISPVIVLAKILMQRLWKSKLKWDDKLNNELLIEYKAFLTALPVKEQIRIPRHVISTKALAYELHGFSDASQVAYGACIYIRSLLPDGTATVKLISSKSKIASISPVTIPRMELLAAVLLVRLVKKVSNALKIDFTTVNLWTDSQIVLAWLCKPPHRLMVFVRNRVAEINANNRFLWRYICTTENPADTVSRGQTATELIKNDKWWNGPSFLHTISYEVDIPNLPSDCELPELRPAVLIHIAMLYTEFPILTKFESFRKTQRIVAYMLRFISNLRKKKENRTLAKYLTVPELREAMKIIIGAIQLKELYSEIESVKVGETNHRLMNLNPFLDNDLLRVGGRISHSNLPYETKHQLILPDKNPLVRSLIAAVHRENLHAGPSSVIAILRQQFWLLNARSTVRKVIRGCVVCFRNRPTLIDQQMGELPSYRVNAAPVFSQVGVDFAGPILVKQSSRRAIPVKGYICIFVCMVTKAIHLEAVENLSTEAFLAAFQRFVSRRGIPHTVFSDNGTNFIGAKSELHDLYVMFQKEVTQSQLHEFCQVKEINWRTIPPNSPHFGGLWEAGVKSVKSVLKKVYKSATLTIFELYTLLCQVEAILNSRPMFAHSNDSRDPQAITPGHFMINRPLVAVPEPSYQEIPSNRLSRWQHIQQLREHFWKRWSKEYLTELQVRGKWTKKRVNVKPGLVVLLKEDNLPPQSWKLGRIINVYPGTDGLVRIADVKTISGIYKRPIHKLAPLPILDNLTISENNDKLTTFCRGENVQSAPRSE